MSKRYEACHTSEQRKLLRQADKLLRKAGYFPKREEREEVVVEADAIGQNGRLRPTWTGRA